MKKIILGLPILLIIFLSNSYSNKDQDKKPFDSSDMMIRISEIEIHPEYLDQYIAILKEESEASVRLELGVISIFPMFQKENPNQIRILEIYEDKASYQSHLQTPHFKHYKTSTLNMVKTLRLIDMEAIDSETMPVIFKKLNL